jgi:hypothetical protein
MKLTRTAGLSAAAAVLVAGGVVAGLLVGTHSGGDKSSAAGTPSPSATPSSQPGTPVSTPSGPGPRVKITTVSAPALTPAQVKYQQQSWGDPKTEVGIIILAPKGWKMVKLSTFEVKFTSPNKLWTLRVNGSTPDEPVRQLADERYEVTKASSPDYKLISRVDGTTKATNPNFAGVVFHHTTLTYSYTDELGHDRLVVNRFVGLDNAAHTFYETSAAGRLQDAAALSAITEKATADFIRLP